MADEVVTPVAETKIETAVQPSENPETETKSSETAAPKKKRFVKTESEPAAKSETKEEKVSAVEDARKKKFMHLKMFNLWSTDFVVNDPGLKPYMNLSPVLVPWSAGRNIKKQFWKSKKSIVERLMLKIMVPGHKGKKHYHTSGPNAGSLATIYSATKRTFEIIEQKTKKNPVEVLVRAIEIGSPREGVSYIEYGGVRYPKAADMAPQRRIDLALRWMTQGAFVHTFKGKKHLWDALADEIIATSNNDATKSACLAKRTDLERQAGASR